MKNKQDEAADVLFVAKNEVKEINLRPKREIVSKVYLGREDVEDVKPKKVKRFRCLKCKKSKSFATQKHLERHLQVIHAKKKLKCEICSKLLKSEFYLKRHMSTRHQPREFICDYDGRSFAAKDYIRIHMDRHRLHQILTCSICQKSYISKHTFRRHLKMHIDKHTCQLCGLSFSQKTLLDNHHASKHTLDFNFSCDFCTRKFPSKTARNNHHYIAHKNSKDQLSFKCKECNIYFEMKEELRIHSFIHFNGVIKTCLECDQIFKTNRLLSIHMQKHETKKSFQCTTCGDFFTFKTGLAKHIRLNRCKGPLSNPKLEVGQESIQEDDIIAIAQQQLNEISKPSSKKKVSSLKKEKIVKVSESDSDIVAYGFDDSPDSPDCVKSEADDDHVLTKETRKIRKQKVTRHVRPKQGRAHLIYTCDYCGVDIKFKKEIINHMKQHTIEKKYKCKVCPETFKSRKKLISHSVEVHGVKPLTVIDAFSCEVCDKKFDLKSIYEAHKLSHDDSIRPYACSVCTAAFKSVGNLHRHEATHNMTRDFECSQENCGKRFKTKLALKIHNETVHPEVKVFVNCNICNTIIQEKYIRVHMRNQHTEEGKEKPFCCTICYKTFKTERLGQRHYDAVHDPKNQGNIYSCPQCPELQFYRQRDLKQHSFIHYDGVIFQCSICMKMFKNKRLLSIHGAVHSSDGGNFPCKHCDNVVFKTRGGRRKHIMRVHGAVNAE